MIRTQGIVRISDVGAVGSNCVNSMDACIVEHIVGSVDDVATLVALDLVNKLFHSFTAIKLKVLRSQGVWWITRRNWALRPEWLLPSDSRGIRVCVFGLGETGKSSIVARFGGGGFDESYVPTVGGRLLEIPTAPTGANRGSVELAIWDVEGPERERFSSTLTLFSHGAVVFVLVYDVTYIGSLNYLSIFLTGIRYHAEPYHKFLLCGNKADSVLDNRSSTTSTSPQKPATHSQGLEFAKANNFDGFIEVSAKTGRNIPQLLQAIGALALEGSASQRGVTSPPPPNIPQAEPLPKHTAPSQPYPCVLM
ncbi:Ras family [Pelomyxa schiedti]|nr:Ras family [Pelomyxa schiedti]